ncbi:hypothetical protein VTP01DRAFT_6544 [Rhizomucor pusillus]|uniref:uncharacterized protein n=1 Tax=Rhizomucor pusillus TaxID=4840 RepID=UPI00374201FC
MSATERYRRSSVLDSQRNNIVGANDHDLRIGARVQVQGKIGTIRYAGTTSFQTGKWIGIELDEPTGKNSGVVQGKRYFDCRLNHGVFVRPSQVKLLPSTPSTSSTTSEDDGMTSPVSASSIDRFAPPQDPGLAAARSAQQRTPSPSSTLLPSRISSPKSRVARLQQQSPPTATGLRRPGTMIASARGNVAPTSSVTMTTRTRAKPQGQQRPRSGTQGSASQRASRILASRVGRTSEPQTSPSRDEEVVELGQHTEQGELQEDDDREEEKTKGETQEEIINGREEKEEEEEEQEQQKPVSVSPGTQQPEDSRPSSVYGSLAPNMPVSKSEQMVPMKDYEELRLKLKILETKRQEDRERQREHEKVKEEAEQFLTLRNKLQDKIAELQKDLRETKRELKESNAEREVFESKYTDILESLEMMTLDKEVAEERAENLQQEVNVLKDKIEEISVDLDVLRKEADILNRAPEKEGDERSPLEVIQLERHNERLKEALMRLRDATTEHEAELNRKIKALEKENYELEEYKVQYEKVKDKLEHAELQIDDLKQRLDDALGAEDLVEQLTEQNLTLKEKLEEMKAAIEDLEALKELADELEENHIETEKQLQAEIDHRDMLLREQLERIRSAEETNADYEATIHQFRELVMNLQSDLEQLRHKEQNQLSEKHSLSSQSQAMMSLNMQLQTTVMKAQAKAIDLELRKLEAAQANDRLAYIQPYLPDSFFKTENDPISCLLLFKRLVFKSELIIKHLDQNHPISEKIMDTVSESLVVVCEMRQRAGWLGDLAKRFVTFIMHCSPDIFTKMGQVFHDLVGTERRLNGIVELLRTDELKENDCIVDLQRMIAQLEHLADVYLVQNGESILVDQFFGLTRALDLNADRMTVELTFIKQTVENAVKKEGISISEGQERLDMDFSEPLGRLVSQAKNSKLIAKKLIRQLEDLSEQALMLKSEHLHRFRTLYAISSKLSQFCFDVYRQIASYVDTKRGSREEINLNIIQQIVYSKADEILEIAESTMWEGCLRTLKSLTNELNTTVTRVENDNKMDKITTGIAPWIQRASDMKAEVVVSHDMERKLQQHSEEILKLIKDVKLKDQALQEANVKVELLEKRMVTAKKQVEHIAILEESLQKSQSQELVYAEAIENLQAEFDALEKENARLKKLADVQLEEKRQSANKKAEEESVPEVQTSAEGGSYVQVSGQVETLKAAIRYLRAENSHLKSIELSRSLKIEKLPQDTTAQNDETKDLLRSVAVETRALVKDMRVAGASMRVVALSSDRRGGKWQSRKKLPDYQYQSHQSVLYTLKQRSEQLRTKMDTLQHDHHRLPTPSTKQQGSNLLSKSLAKIQIPVLSSLPATKGRRRIVIKSAAEFDKIHSVFLR